MALAFAMGFASATDGSKWSTPTVKVTNYKRAWHKWQAHCPVRNGPKTGIEGSSTKYVDQSRVKQDLMHSELTRPGLCVQGRVRERELARGASVWGKQNKRRSGTPRSW